jgi:hypothetical protein
LPILNKFKKNQILTAAAASVLTVAPVYAANISLYRFRLHHNNKIESTVNIQPLSFSTPPSKLKVNSQQSTIIPV